MSNPVFCCRIVGLLIGLILCPQLKVSFAATKISKSLSIKTPSPITCMTYANHPATLITGHADGKARWWNDEGKITGDEWPVLDKPIVAMEFANGGTYFIVATSDSVVHIFDSAKRALISQSACKGKITHIADHAYGLNIAVAADEIALIGIRKGDILNSYSYDQSATTLFFTPEGSRLFVGGPKEQKLIELPKAKAQTTFLTSGFRHRGKPLRNLSLSQNREVYMGAFDGGVLVPFFTLESTPTHETTIPGLDQFRVLASHKGSHAICIGINHKQAVTPGVVWNLVDNVLAANIDGLPASITQLAFHPSFNHLAILSSETTVDVWKLNKAAEYFFSVDSLLGKKVLNAKGQEKLLAENRDINPLSPVRGTEILVDHAKFAKAPGYMDGAWQLKPKRTNGRLDNLNISKPGVLFYIMPDSPEGNLELQKQWFDIREILTRRDRWYDCGDCPWRKNATMLCRLETIEEALHGGLLSYVGKDDELYFVPNITDLSPATYKTFPPFTQHRILSQKITWLFKDRKFSEIEALAMKFHKSKTMLGFGMPAIGAVYSGMKELPPESKPNRKELLDEYRKKFPKSFVARIGMSHYFKDLAWKTRGYESDPMTPRDQRERFKSLLKESRDILIGIDCPRNDPYVSLCYLTSAAIEPMTSSSVINLTMKGFTSNYMCLDAVDAAGNFLLLRWSGDAQGPMKLAQRFKLQYPGDAGDALACRLVSGVINNELEPWQHSCGLEADDLDPLIEAMRRVNHMDYATITTCVMAQMAEEESQEKRQKMWQSLGSHVELSSKDQFFSKTAEWNDAVERAPEKQQIWTSFQSSIVDACFTRGSKQLVLVDRGGILHRIDSESGKQLSQIATMMPNTAREIACDQSNSVSILTRSGVIRIKDKNLSFCVLPDIRDHAQALISPDCSRVLCLKNFFTTSLVDISSNDAVPVASFPELVRYSDRVETPMVISSDSTMAAIASASDTVTFIDMKAGNISGSVKVSNGTVRYIDFHSGKNRLIIATETSTAEFDTKTKGLLSTTSSPIASPGDRLQISHDGKYWAVVKGSVSKNGNKEVVIIDRSDTERKWRTLPGFRNDAQITWHPSESRLIVFTDSGVLSCWDFSRGLE
ncbi:WD40 repeat domain-containing protein [Planctopirus hydrillae]|nr:WD40 repeat domain-containing protein [Planctopirus hydrillae]